MVNLKIAEDVVVDDKEKAELIKEFIKLIGKLEENDEFLFSMEYNDEKIFYLVEKEGNMFTIQTRLDERHVI